MTTGDQNPSAVITEDAPAGVVVREGVYGDKVGAVEPGGAEFIPLSDRHGKPLQLFWTWMSPNLEFATVFVGVHLGGVLRPELLAGDPRHRDRHRRWARSPTGSCRRAGRCSACHR